MPFITTQDKTNLYFKRWGNGRPVVLIHGWPLTADTWDEVGVSLVENGYQVVAYDRRGFGRSDQPWDGYTYDRLSDDLLDLLQELRLENVTLVGFSMGGGEVARYMFRHAGVRVHSTSLIASIVPYMLKTEDNPGGVPTEQFESIKAAIRKDRAAFFGTFFNDFFGKTLMSQPASNEVLAWCREQSMKASVKATLDCVDAFGTTDLRRDLPSFDVPTLILHGMADRIVPIEVSARQAAAGIRDSTLIEYPDAPHGLLVTHRERVVSDLLGFLKSID
jgi:non-heme chloroperoxidase